MFIEYQKIKTNFRSDNSGARKLFLTLFSKLFLYNSRKLDAYFLPYLTGKGE